MKNIFLITVLITHFELLISQYSLVFVTMNITIIRRWQLLLPGERWLNNRFFLIASCPLAQVFEIVLPKLLFPLKDC